MLSTTALRVRNIRSFFPAGNATLTEAQTVEIEKPRPGRPRNKRNRSDSDSDSEVPVAEEAAGPSGAAPVEASRTGSALCYAYWLHAPTHTTVGRVWYNGWLVRML